MYLRPKTSKCMPELVFEENDNRDRILVSLAEISTCVSHSWIETRDWIFQIPECSNKLFN